MMKTFTAIDFETATSNRNSACALGIIRYENLKVIFQEYFLIRPPGNDYQRINSSIHGIVPIDTEQAPTFKEIWPSIEQFFVNQTIVAHNVSFDISVLNKTLMHYSIEPPSVETFCTYRQLTGIKLNRACEQYGIELNHHHALSDAIACASLYLLHIDNKIEAIKGFRSNSNTGKSRINRVKINSKLLKPNTKCYDKNNRFFEKKVVISGVFNKYTRQELAKLLWEKGADINTSISKNTDYVLAGDKMGPAKKVKAEKLGIPVISEKDFEEMIGNS